MDELGDHLDRLETTGLIRIAQLAPELEYLFRHALVQDAAYATLLRQDRKVLHRAVALAIEEAYPDRLEEFAAVLALHFSQSDDDSRALHYFTLAGDVAIARYANTEAIQHYGRAIEIEKRSPGGSLSHPYLQRGHACEFIGDYSGALATYIDLQDTARARGDKPAELAALMALATIRATTTPVQDLPGARRLLDAALALARELGDRAAESKTLWNLLLYHKFTGNPTDAVRCGEESLAIARQLDLREQMAFTMGDLMTHGYLDAGELGKARALVDEVHALWEQLGNRPMLADSYSSSAILYYILGEYDNTVRASEEARRISEGIDNRWGQSYSRLIVGQVYRDRGEVGLAVETMEHCIELGEQCGFLGAVVGVGSELAMILGSLGMLDEALSRINRALTASERQLPGWMGWVLSVLANVQVLAGDLGAATQTAGRIEHIVDQGTLIKLPLAVCSVQMALATVRLANSDIGGAHRALDTIESYALRTQMRIYLPDLHLLRGRAYLAQNEPGQARGAFEKACAAAEVIGSRWVLWKALAALAELAGREGRQPEADELRQQAAEIITYISTHMDRAELRESFLKLEDVRAVMDRV